MLGLERFLQSNDYPASEIILTATYLLVQVLRTQQAQVHIAPHPQMLKSVVQDIQTRCITSAGLAAANPIRIDHDPRPGVGAFEHERLVPGLAGRAGQLHFVGCARRPAAVASGQYGRGQALLRWPIPESRTRWASCPCRPRKCCPHSRTGGRPPGRQPAGGIQAGPQAHEPGIAGRQRVQNGREAGLEFRDAVWCHG